MLEWPFWGAMRAKPNCGNEVALRGIEAGRVVNPLNKVLGPVFMLVHVQDGLYVKVVQQHDFLQLWLIDGSLDNLTHGIGHIVGHGASVLHGLHVEDLLRPVACVALG